MQNRHSFEERRRRSRLDLQWPVQFVRKRDEPRVAATTRNLSTAGFYCLSEEPLTPGESLDCVIRMPDVGAYSRDGVLGLHCRVQVVRVEKVYPDEAYGIACRIEDYKLVSSDHRASMSDSSAVKLTA